MSRSNPILFIAVIAGLSTARTGLAAPEVDENAKRLSAYFRSETTRLAEATLADVKSKQDWLERRAELHRQLREMLGLDPWPERTPLKPVVTGTIDHDEFTVERLHYQSRPGLYVTGNLYVPKDRDENERLPAILYVCGHGRVKKDGTSFGNKTHYQHHGAWFARNGYVCLTIDTIQLGEIEGVHHGTYRHGRWWWPTQGYTPAGVEAWNGIRGIDFLQSRPEVDPQRIGVTGRSGGGAYSWWVAALDERVKCAVPVAGITSMKNHVVDDCIEGHCDCMFMVNTYRWDFPLVAALVAPRPLLISNTDKDRIFPLDGVVDVYGRTRRLYRLLDAENNIGLHITEGPHSDTQELRIHAFRWLNEHLKGDDALIDTTAEKLFDPADLRVFPPGGEPNDERVTSIDETFVPTANPEVPKSKEAWEAMRTEWMTALRERTFRGWPAEPGDLDVEMTFTEVHDGMRLSRYEFTSQQHVRLPLFVAHRDGLAPEKLDLVVLNVLDDAGWKRFAATMRAGFADRFTGDKTDRDAFRQLSQMFAGRAWGMAYVPPRGIGPTAWTSDDRERTHIRRRFLLLGQSLDGMRILDATRAAAALRTGEGFDRTPLWLQGEDAAAGIALHASLFVPNVERVDLWRLGGSYRTGPTLLNVRRWFDVPQAVGMAAESTRVVLYDSGEDNQWTWTRELSENVGWEPKQLQFRRTTK